MDPLSDVLRLVRLTGTVFLSAEFSAPWSVVTRAVPGQDAMRSTVVDRLVHYHLITEGQCVLAMPGTQPMLLGPGDLIVFPHGDEHVLASSAELEPVPTADLLEPTAPDSVRRLVHGGGGASTKMICGFLTCDPHLCRPLISALPRVLKFSTRAEGAAPWIEASMRFTLQEAAQERAGGGIVLARLAELLFVDAVRRYIDSLPAGQQGWFAGLRDRHVGRVLALMHERPAYPWTVEEFAKRVSMSRSALAQRFVQVMGKSPMAHLAVWRMQLAAEMLLTGHLPICAICETVGYDSEPAFHRAFKRMFGMPPAAFRRSGGIGASAASAARPAGKAAPCFRARGQPGKRSSITQAHLGASC